VTKRERGVILLDLLGLSGLPVDLVFGDGLDRSTIALDLQPMTVLGPSIRIMVIMTARLPSLRDM